MDIIRNMKCILLLQKHSDNSFKEHNELFQMYSTFTLTNHNQIKVTMLPLHMLL